jgi:hypothetical protein
VVILVIVVVCGAAQLHSQTKGSFPKESPSRNSPPPLSREFRTAGQLAEEAIDRVTEAIDEPRLFYEPRYLDAEKAVAEAQRKAKSSEEKKVAEILNAWLWYLSNQRLYGPSWKKVNVEVWKVTILPCWLEASWHLGGKLTEKGVEKAMEGTCLPQFRRDLASFSKQ